MIFHMSIEQFHQHEHLMPTSNNHAKVKKRVRLRLVLFDYT